MILDYVEQELPHATRIMPNSYSEDRINGSALSRSKGLNQGGTPSQENDANNNDIINIEKSQVIKRESSNTQSRNMIQNDSSQEAVEMRPTNIENASLSRRPSPK